MENVFILEQEGEVGKCFPNWNCDGI